MTRLSCPLESGGGGGLGARVGGSGRGTSRVDFSESSRGLNLQMGLRDSPLRGERLSTSLPTKLLSGALAAARRSIAERIVQHVVTEGEGETSLSAADGASSVSRNASDSGFAAAPGNPG